MAKNKKPSDETILKALTNAKTPIWQDYDPSPTEHDITRITDMMTALDARAKTYRARMMEVFGDADTGLTPGAASALTILIMDQTYGPKLREAIGPEIALARWTLGPILDGAISSAMALGYCQAIDDLMNERIHA